MKTFKLYPDSNVVVFNGTNFVVEPANVLENSYDYLVEEGWKLEDAECFEDIDEAFDECERLNKVFNL